MVKMNPKTIVTNLLLLLLLQISNLSIGAISFKPRPRRKHYTPEYSIPPSTITRIVVVNELYGLGKGNAGFVCSHGPKVWRKSKPGDRYLVIEFVHTGIQRYKFVQCHVRSSRGFVNVPIDINPDTSAKCYFSSYTCHYIIRKDGLYYKPEKKLLPWQPFPRSKNGQRPKA